MGYGIQEHYDKFIAESLLVKGEKGRVRGHVIEERGVM